MEKESKIPNAFVWFSKLKLNKFIPWHFDTEIDFLICEVLAGRVVLR